MKGRKNGVVIASICSLLPSTTARKHLSPFLALSTSFLSFSLSLSFLLLSFLFPPSLFPLSSFSIFCCHSSSFSRREDLFYPFLSLTFSPHLIPYFSSCLSVVGKECKAIVTPFRYTQASFAERKKKKLIESLWRSLRCVS